MCAVGCVCPACPPQLPPTPGAQWHKRHIYFSSLSGQNRQIPRFQFHFPGALTALSWVTLKSQGHLWHCCSLPGTHRSFFPVTTCPGAAPLWHRSQSPEKRLSLPGHPLFPGQSGISRQEEPQACLVLFQSGRRSMGCSGTPSRASPAAGLPAPCPRAPRDMPRGCLLQCRLQHPCRRPASWGGGGGGRAGSSMLGSVVPCQPRRWRQRCPFLAQLTSSSGRIMQAWEPELRWSRNSR